MKRNLLALALALTFATFASAQDAPPTAPPENALKSESGLAWLVVKEPTGDRTPAADEFVTLDYTGWRDGKVFDSTAKHPTLKTFGLAKLWPGLRQVVETMKVGEARRIWIPGTLAPKNAAVVMDVELLEISQPLQVPADVAAPPADAERSRSGLAWKVLTPGTGTTHPTAKSFVSVHYTGWTTSGEMFDSSYLSGAPAAFTLDQVIAGWREGVQLMTVGEKRRFWIPAKLAYRDQRGMPQGMLVFDVELLKFN